MVITYEDFQEKLKKCDKYVFSYGAFNVLLTADLIAGMALNETRPDIIKKLIVAGGILAVGAVASMLKYFKALDRLVKQSDDIKRENKSKGKFKISKELNKLLDKVVYDNNR